MDYTQIVSSVGFPIAITMFVLFRLEKTLKDNTKTLNMLTEVIKSNYKR